jgi:hypothetical protein
MSSGSNPAARATTSSPDEATSAPASLCEAMSWHTARLGFALREKATSVPTASRTRRTLSTIISPW